MIQVVRSHHFVLDPLVVKLYCVVGVIAPKNKKVFYRELVLLGPSNFEALLLFIRR